MRVHLTTRLPVALRLLSSNLLVTAATFVTGVILARALGAEGRGIFAALAVWATTIASIGLLGTHIYLARKAGEAQASLSTVYATAYRILLLTCPFAIAAYFAVLWFFVRPEIEINMTLIVIGALIVPGSMIGAMQLQIELGRRAFGTYNFARQSFALVFAISAVALWLSDIREVPAFVVALISATYACFLATRLKIRRGMSAEANATPKAAASILQTIHGARGFAAITLFTSFAMQADKLLLSGSFPAVALGYFVVASSLAQLQNTVGEAFSQPFFAGMTACKGADHIDMEWMAQRLRQTVIVSAFVCIGALLVLPPIVPYIYGSDFTASATLLLVLLPGIALRTLTRPYEELFKGLGYARPLLWILASTVGVMLVGILLAAELGSVWGVAWAVLGGNLAGFVTALAFARRLFAVPIVATTMPRPADFANILDRLEAVVKATKP